ncbi:hypothetical protein [Bordetella sp. 15P40C-2]|uniref:hypothetical protein n=1 Tax=Bordetella sp. 15P40C-2 TaxID=2572246 RepID=UPI00132569E1|nr:hypothetical protein [Bordetella sp. 15P40C-2]MVW70031.1 hypothetical protein [Bordetella sp. 15P40C-2]
MSNFAEPSKEWPDELTFFIRGHHPQKARDALTFVVRAACALDARTALEARGYCCDHLTPVTAPREEGFRVRQDGTVLLAASGRHATLRLYGPFNDEVDAMRWATIHGSASRDDETVYMPIDPDFCFRVARVDGVPVILEFPPDFFSTPL